MNTIEFTLRGMGGEKEVTGTIVEFLKSLPYLFLKYVPTRTVINSVLEQGCLEAGMSGGVTWVPFKLGNKDYEHVARLLEIDGLKKLDAPDWVLSHSDWMIWIYEVDHNVPSKEHRRLSLICDDIESKLDKAEKAGRIDETEELHLEYLEASNKMSEFVHAHFKR